MHSLWSSLFRNNISGWHTAQVPRDDLHFFLSKQYLNPSTLLPLPLPTPPRPSMENAEFSAGDIGDFGPSRNRQLTKFPQAEISGRKLLRPKPLESVPQFCLPLPSPSPSNKAGWAFKVNCSGINLCYCLPVTVLVVVVVSSEARVPTGYNKLWNTDFVWFCNEVVICVGKLIRSDEQFVSTSCCLFNILQGDRFTIIAHMVFPFHLCFSIWSKSFILYFVWYDL